jgi:hypothetical protein
MLNVDQLSKKIADLAADDISVSDFQSWFRRESRNVHLWGDELLKEAVFSVESIFSEYHFADLDDAGLKRELASTIDPFVVARVTLAVSESVSESSPVTSTADESEKAGPWDDLYREPIRHWTFAPPPSAELAFEPV